MRAVQDKHIGRLIYFGRVFQHLTADEVARRCNVTRSRVYQWEQQDFILPKNLAPLAVALGLPLRTLELANGAKPKRQKNQHLSKIRLNGACDLAA